MNNTTPIEFLPELEDLEQNGNTTFGGDSILPFDELNRMNKYIRGGYKTPEEAGMNPRVEQQYHIPQSFQMPPQEYDGVHKSINMPTNLPNCLEVAEHIMNCPICSKFYNNDKTIYIIAIVALAIICVLLLKKVMDT